MEYPAGKPIQEDALALEHVKLVSCILDKAMLLEDYDVVSQVPKEERP